MKRFSKLSIVLLVMIFTLSSLVGCTSKTPEPTQANPSEEADQGGIIWPEKTIQVTVPYNAGGDTDLYARTAAKYLEKELGETIVVVNTAGASGMNAAHQVMDSKADGYNLLFRHTAQLITQATGLADLSYTDDMDIAGTAIEDNTYTLVVRKDSGFKNLKDLVEYAKANPNKLTYSNVHGSVTHYASIQMKEEMGIEFKDLDVGSSSADRTAAFMGGQVDMLIANYITLKDYIESGEFIVMGILAEERVPALPEVPTLKEQGYHVVTEKVYTFAFPKGTDKAIVEKFNTALKKVSENPEFKKEVESFYGAVKFRSIEETYDFETKLVEKMRNAMKDTL
ncbi:tripartite tricarboxylate transporter substrate binding protein [Clostridiaceae bacterium 35-E11]